MSVLRLKDGVPLLEDGKLGLGTNCCCGACCNGSSCTQKNKPDCEASGGVWQGASVDCSSSPCLPDCGGPCVAGACAEPCICRCPDTDVETCGTCCVENGLCPCPDSSSPVFLTGTDTLTPAAPEFTNPCKYAAVGTWNNGCCSGDVVVEADICCDTFNDTAYPVACSFGCASNCTLTNITITFTDNLPCDCPGAGPDTSAFQYFYCSP